MADEKRRIFLPADCRANRVNKGTVSRELKRNGGIEKYLPIKAQTGYELRRLKCRRRHILDDGELYEYVKKKLFEEQWSPEQIAGRLFMERGKKAISFPTIYREIYSGRFDKDAPVKSKIGAAKLLRRKGKSLRGKKSGVKKAGPVKNVMIKLLEGKPCETITPDSGTEFASHEDVTKAFGGVQFYFPPLGQPWQRGINENCNGLLREYFPKEKDLSGKSNDYIQAVADKINKRPRKSLGWKTPFEVFYSKSLRLT